jgi:hypothetical protein
MDTHGNNTRSGKRLGKGAAVWAARNIGWPGATWLEPCKGPHGDIFNAMVALGLIVDWCERQLGRDFLLYEGHVDIILSNLPWGTTSYGVDEFTPMFRKCFAVADHVILILPTTSALGFTGRNNFVRDAGFGIRTIVRVAPDCVPKSFRPGGYQQGIVHWHRGYRAQSSTIDWR